MSSQIEHQDEQQRIAELEQRVATLERLHDDQILEWARRKQQGHEEAKRRDAREKLETGEVRTIVIQSPPGKESPDAFTKIEGIATFVDPAGKNLPSGATVRAKLTDVRESSAHAIALEVLDAQS
ncbi:hypothetical protein [Natronorubrum bangense]|uniref:TRAM domain-containing protein n=1 Tax=Natronorubrum bangense TaxID=61858 RepID=A0A4D6HTY9_9EURY|nr:hypothetical protein [Natronorubrum bangense]QCC56991.1 hypothetical protein DV706_20905 [Natronorubrum bangense]